MADGLLWVGAGLAVGLSVLAGTKTTSPPGDQAPAVRELPDPFRFRDGSRVRTRSDWTRRRKELKELIQQCAYGRLPPAPRSIKAEDQSSEPVAGVSATERKLVLSMGPDRKVSTHVVLTVPDGHGPFPAIIDGDLCWGRRDPAIVAEVVKRGYLLAEFDRTELVPDANSPGAGLHAVYPDLDFGALAGWAWGFHRLADYLRTLPEVDRDRIAVTGHSRGGKAALLAGALDERIALTVPNGSGCMGAGCTRFLHDRCETLADIVRAFPFWFSSRLPQYVGHEDELPFDQHSLKALVAPRPLLSTEAMGDTWANPPGTQQTFQAARVVYQFLGTPDRIGISYRDGGHAHTLADWEALLDFADWQHRGKPNNRRFDTLAYPDASKEAFTWAAPSRAAKGP